MEKKTTHRVIGVLVILALVIIFLPLAFNNGNFKTPIQTAELKAPPFPEPQVKVQNVAMNTSIKKAAAVANKDVTETKTILAANDSSKLATDMHATGLISQVIKHATKENPVVIVGENGEAVQLTAAAMRADLDKAQQILNESKAAQQSAQEVVNGTVASHMVLTKASVSSSKTPTWAIQMGSFKNQANVNRLVAQLKSKGYKVFTVPSKDNTQTRVYVGPEIKQLAASTLAGKIAQDVNLHGVVVNYKPLEA